MQTITIRVSDNALEELMRFLEGLGKNEFQILTDLRFADVQNQVERDFFESKDQKNSNLSLAEFEIELEELLKNHGA